MNVQGIPSPIVKDFSTPTQKNTAQGSQGAAASSEQVAEWQSWLEQATAYLAGVTNGDPNYEAATPEQLRELENQIAWVQAQLGIGSNWGQDISGMGGTANAYQDPFGGYVHDGSLIYEGQDVNIGWNPDNPYPANIFASDTFRLDVSSPAVDIQITRTTQAPPQPGEEVIKIIAKHKVTGKEQVYYVQGDASIEINTLNPEQVQDATGEVTVGQFKEGELLGGGLPDYSSIEGNSATVDGVHGSIAEITPPFGGVSEINLYSDANLQVLNTDQVEVHRAPGGGSRIKIIRADGTEVTIHLAPGFKLNIGANPKNITFFVAPRLGNKQVSGSEGVPMAFGGKIEINGKGYSPPRADNTDVSHPGNSQEVLDFLENLGLDASTEIPEALKEEIDLGIWPPSQNLFDWMHQNSPSLGNMWNSYWDSLKQGSPSKTLLSQFRDGLLDVLKDIYPNTDLSSSGQLPEGVTWQESASMMSIFVNGNHYQVYANGDTDGDGVSSFGILESDFNVTPTGSNENVGDSSEASQAIAERLAALGLKDPQDGSALSANEIIQVFAEKGIKLDELSLASAPGAGFGQDFWEVAYQIDPSLREKLAAMKEVDWPGQSARPVTERVIDYLRALFPNYGFASTTQVDVQKYQNDIRVTDPSGKQIIFEAFGDAYLDGYSNANPWSFLGPWFHHEE